MACRQIPDAHQLPRQTPHCIDHWPTHGSGHCGTSPRWHTHRPFIHTQAPHGLLKDFSWHMIEGFLKVNQGNMGPFVGSGDVLLLQLLNNEYCVRSTSTRHKGELHLIDVQHLVDGGIEHPFPQLHDYLWAWDMIVTMVKGFTLALIEVQDEALLPSTGIIPLLKTASASFPTSSTLYSSAGFSISAMIPEGPTALLRFTLLSALRICVANTLGGGQQV